MPDGSRGFVALVSKSAMLCLVMTGLSTFCLRKRCWTSDGTLRWLNCADTAAETDVFVVLVPVVLVVDARGEVAAITAAAIAWIIAGDGVAFTFVIGGVEGPVDGNGSVLMSSKRFGSKKSAGLVAGLKCRPSISNIIWTSF